MRMLSICEDKQRLKFNKNSLSLGVLSEIANAGCSRLIIACENRLDIPRELGRWWRTEGSEIPIALACDDWWQGARRTGWKSPEIPAWSWSLWWEEWLPWLAGPSTGNQYGGLQQAALPGLVLSKCFNSGSAWCQLAQTLGRECRFCKDLDDWFSQSTSDVEWLLIDDTGSDSDADTLVAELEHARAVFPTVPIAVAFGFVRYDIWQRCRQAGASEILSKTGSMCGLAHWLDSLRTAPRT